MKLACDPFGSLLWCPEKGILNQSCLRILLFIEFIFLELPLELWGLFFLILEELMMKKYFLIKF